MNLRNSFSEYQKYRWFLASTGKLVVGGKSAEQNEKLLKKLKQGKEDFVVMHTSTPGSPFSVIISDKKEIQKTDIEEAAIFTGCFSREWRAGKKTAHVDIFSLSQLYKDSKMKEGTWGVKGKIIRKAVQLNLVLTKQEGKLRAVSEKTVRNKKEIIIKIIPGKTPKEIFAQQLTKKISSLKQEEILSALPAGGVEILK